MVTPGCAQVLLLAPCSGITADSAPGIIWGARDQSVLAKCEASILLIIQSLWSIVEHLRGKVEDLEVSKDSCGLQDT